MTCVLLDQSQERLNIYPSFKLLVHHTLCFVAMVVDSSYSNASSRPPSFYAQLSNILRAVKFDSGGAFPRGYEADFQRALLTFRHQVCVRDRSAGHWVQAAMTVVFQRNINLKRALIFSRIVLPAAASVSMPSDGATLLGMPTSLSFPLLVKTLPREMSWRFVFTPWPSSLLLPTAFLA